MIIAIKWILTLVVLLLLSYPFIPMKGALRKLSVASSLQYHSPHNRKNIFFVFLSILEFILIVFVFKAFDTVAKIIEGIPFFGKLITTAIDNINSQIDYVFFAIKMIIINLIVIYLYVFAKAFVKKIILNPLFGLGKRKKKFSLFKKHLGSIKYFLKRFFKSFFGLMASNIPFHFDLH